MLSVFLILLAFSGCRQEMGAQPSYRPLESSPLFEDGMSARHPPAGTVACGQLDLDPRLYQGKEHPAPAGLFVAAMIGLQFALPLLVLLSSGVKRRPGRLAAANQQGYEEKVGRQGTCEGWHFLTGDEDQIRFLPCRTTSFRNALTTLSSHSAWE